jgi:hypothetical protein
MKRVFFRLHTGYCGEDGYDVIDYDDDVTTDELDQDAWYKAVEWASSYGRDLCDEYCDDPECESEHIGSTNIEGTWAWYNPEEHDRYSTDGKW